MPHMCRKVPFHAALADAVARSLQDCVVSLQCQALCRAFDSFLVRGWGEWKGSLGRWGGRHFADLSSSVGKKEPFAT
jgi:hypothetical protein